MQLDSFLGYTTECHGSSVAAPSFQHQSQDRVLTAAQQQQGVSVPVSRAARGDALPPELRKGLVKAQQSSHHEPQQNCTPVVHCHCFEYSRQMRAACAKVKQPEKPNIRDGIASQARPPSPCRHVAVAVTARTLVTGIAGPHRLRSSADEPSLQAPPW